MRIDALCGTLAAVLLTGCAATAPLVEPVASKKTAAASPKTLVVATSDKPPETGADIEFSTEEVAWLERMAATNDAAPSPPQRPTGRRAAALRPLAFRFADLPQGKIAPMTGRPPPELPKTEPMPHDVELTAKRVEYGYPSPYRTYALRPTGFTAVDVRIASWGGAANEGQVLCGAAATEYGPQTYYGGRAVAVHWEGIRPVATGGIEYAIADGWLDPITCRVRVHERQFFPLGEIVPGLVYGFRTCPDEAAESRGISCAINGKLTLVFPKSNAIAVAHREPTPPQPMAGLSRVTLSFRRGVGDSLSAQIAEADWQSWAKAAGKTVIEGPGLRHGESLVLSVEIQMSSTDDEPTAVAFVGDTGNSNVDLLSRR